jgi:hypothetical protein
MSNSGAKRLREHAPSYATLKNWVAQFKRGDFSTCVAPCPGRPKTVATPEIIDQIHELIVEDGGISAGTFSVTCVSMFYHMKHLEQ